MGLRFTADLLPFLPALFILVKRHPDSPDVLLLCRLGRLLTNDGVEQQGRQGDQWTSLDGHEVT